MGDIIRRKKEKVINTPKSGIIYPINQLWSGQETSWYTGDEGDRFQDGDFNNLSFVNPMYTQQLDLLSAEPRKTLKFLNKWGNYNRYTDFEGLQNYPNATAVIGGSYTAKVVIDNLFDLAYSIPTNSWAYGIDMASAISAGTTYSSNGLTGWRLASYLELVNLANFELAYSTDFSPLDFNIGGQVTMSCTIQAADTSRYLSIIPSSGRSWNIDLVTTGRIPIMTKRLTL